MPMPFPCHAVPKGLQCVFPIWFTQCGRVWFTLAMPRPCHALTMPFFSRPRHSMAVERRPVGSLPAFGFFLLPRGVPQRLLSKAYQSFSQRSIPMSVKSGSSTLQKRRSVELLDWQFGYFRLPHRLSRRTRQCRSSGAAWHVWINGMAWHGEQHAMCESAFSVLYTYKFQTAVPLFSICAYRTHVSHTITYSLKEPNTFQLTSLHQRYLSRARG
jgi:hypothetical protein